LTARYQKCNLQAGFALSEGQGQPFEKGSLHPAETFVLSLPEKEHCKIAGIYTAAMLQP
jgi:hypothetical protein